MRLALERYRRKGWLGGESSLQEIQVSVQFSEEEKEIIKVANVGYFIFFDVPKDPDSIAGDAFRPKILLNDLLKGKPIHILPLDFSEAHYLRLEEEVRGAARDTKAFLDDMNEKITNRKSTLDL